MSGRRAVRLIYLDANVFIYAVEGFAEYRDGIATLFGRIGSGELNAITSELTLAEVLVKPLAVGNEAAVRAYKGLIRSRDYFSVGPVDRKVLVRAAELRAEVKITLPDAIHVATAELRGVDAFVTNDRRIRLPAGVERVTLLALGRQ